MVAAAVPRKRSSTNVVSSAPATLPKVDSAKTPPAARAASVRAEQASAKSTHSARSHPIGAMPSTQ